LSFCAVTKAKDNEHYDGQIYHNPKVAHPRIQSESHPDQNFESQIHNVGQTPGGTQIVTSSFRPRNPFAQSGPFLP